MGKGTANYCSMAGLSVSAGVGVDVVVVVDNICGSNSNGKGMHPGRVSCCGDRGVFGSRDSAKFFIHFPCT